ncbi:MAG: hypothetical protein LBO78_00755 [Rickettsiales bacterium]|jgi:hypothetical protein|nr:hypothetical protein [Rickettsiales bacterium]
MLKIFKFRPLLAVFACLLLAAVPALAADGYATSPLKGFLIRYSNLFEYARDAFVVLSAFAFVRYAWDALAKGKLELSGLAFLITSLIILVSLESVMLFLADPDDYDYAASELESVTFADVIGKAYTEPPPLSEFEFNYFGSYAPISFYTAGGHRLGDLSSEFESSGDIAAWYASDPGGGSFGKWQISTGSWGSSSNYGSMKSFMGFIRNLAPEVYDELYKAGGYKGARDRDPRFLAAWRKVAAEQPVLFEQLQYDYIYSTHYQPAVDKVYSKFPRLASNPVIDDVLWSMSVQHGVQGAYEIVYGALHGRADIADMPVEQVIDLLYSERPKHVGLYIPNRQMVLDRYPKEKYLALEMLKSIGAGDGGGI